MSLSYSKLGESDLNVSKICLGTMTFGEQTSKKEAFKIMDYAFERGINFFDTAEMYPVYPRESTHGNSERIIGDWIKSKKNRDKVIIASKISSSHPDGQGAAALKWIRGGGKNLKFDKKNLDQAINESLKRLNADYIDLYQLHWPERIVPLFGELEFQYDPKDIDWTPILETLENLNEIIKKGKIRHFGISNETAWGMSKFISLAEKHGLSKPITIQNAYSLLNRVYEISNSEISLRENIGLLAYSPLAGGRLSGKYLNNNKPKNARYTLWPGRFSRHLTERGDLAVQKYDKLAKELEIDSVEMSYSFVLNKPFVKSCIMGVTSLFQLKKNLKCLEIELSQEILKKIDNIHLSDPNPCV
jgi:aryl-alcohol dehydrogenase-like predicted oxidoreductase